MKGKIAVLTFLLVLINISANAQDAIKLKYGKVSVEELEMKTYEKDTSAEAVLLYQYAAFDPYSFKTIEHYRYKILKKTGTGIGSLVFFGRLKGSIKACSYNLEDGKIISTKLDKESVFEEQVVGKIFRTRIAMPNIKEGSVFEVYIYRDGIPNSIEIQREIPVVYSEVYFPQNPKININITHIGILGYTFQRDDHWIAKDIPAFKAEPHITSDYDYRMRIELEITYFNFSNDRYMIIGDFADSWKSVSKNFSESDFFYDKKGSSLSLLFLNPIVDSLKKTYSNEDDLARNAYDFVKSIKWNGYESCYASQDLKKTFQLKKGNSADINFVLIALLQKLGFKSYPVLFSTRDNGSISKFAPTLNKFNHAIAALELQNKTLYLDASEEFLPFGITPQKLTGCNGHPVKEGKGECSVIIKPEKKQKLESQTKFVVDPSGTIEGVITNKRFDYSAINFKNKIKASPNQDEFVRNLETENSGWIIDNYTFSNFDNPYKEFIDQYNVSLSNIAGGNDLLIINPFVLSATKQHPFQLEKRKMPINFTEQTDFSYNITIELPENFKVYELPKNTSLTNKDKSIDYSYTAQNNGNSISISAIFKINKLKFETFEYIELRKLFEQIYQKQSESVVLRKI
ncbi:MAG: hypothetical protein F9K37_03525 [Bacteroidales bacterium]|nr:MAG: hypothetical protein F9K37_03525 [Bacteroidales bacterium]